MAGELSRPASQGLSFLHAVLMQRGRSCFGGLEGQRSFAKGVSQHHEFHHDHYSCLEVVGFSVGLNGHPRAGSQETTANDKISGFVRGYQSEHDGWGLDECGGVATCDERVKSGKYSVGPLMKGTPTKLRQLMGFQA